MAGNGDIRQKIVLEGEKEYSSALKEAQRNLKVLRSELKAETAELGANATAQQKNETRVKNLQKQIREQEKVVKTYEKALAEVREKYGDNEEAIAKWEIKLNEARSTLANMRNGLDETSQSMKSVASSADMGVVAANSFADSLGKIAEVGNTISASIEGVFTGVVGVISDAISALWDQLMDVAARANQWGDIAGYWNTSASNIQKWYHAVQGTYNDFSALSNAVTRIVTGDQKKIAEASGVSAEQYSDKWEYAMAVMDSLGSMDYEKRLEAVGEIFGERRSPQILDLLNDWAKIQANLADFDATNGGYGLTDEQLQKASDLAENVAKVQQSWQALKDMASIELFGNLALNLTGNVQSILDAFKDYFQADNDADRQAALDKVKENVTQIFQSIREAFEEGIKMLGQLAEELKSSQDPAVQALGKILDTLVGAMDWLANPDNWDTIKKGFEGLIAVWATGKVVSAVSNISSFAGNILSIYKWWTGNGGGGGGNSGGGGTDIIGGGGGGVLTGVGTKIAGGLKAAATSTLGTALIGAGISIGGILGVHYLLKGADYEYNDEYDPNRFTQEQLDNLTATWMRMSQSWDLGAGEGATAEDVEEARDGMVDALNEMVENAGSAAEVFKLFEMSNGGNLLYDLMTAGHGYSGTLYDLLASAYGTNWRGWGLSDEQASQWAEGLNTAWAQQAAGARTGTLYGWNDLSDLLLMMGGHFGQYMDIPSDTWNNGLNGDDVSGFKSLPQGMLAAVQKGVSGVRVVLDGQVVGNLVAPYVSEQIAREVG